MWNELLATFREIALDSSADRVVVLTGAGGDFCSGADLSGGGADDPERHQLTTMRHIGDVALALHRLPQPTIAKVRGVAVGAGLNMALGCDLVVASTNARFSEIFARRGLSIDFGGSWVLPRRVGLHRAKELALLADIIDATEAERIGLVNRVVAGRRARRVRRRLGRSSRRRSTDRAGDDQAHAEQLGPRHVGRGARRRGRRADRQLRDEGHCRGDGCVPREAGPELLGSVTRRGGAPPR